MNSCTCHDWKAVGELFHEAIEMIHIDYCPWCRSELYPREVAYIHQELTKEPFHDPTNPDLDLIQKMGWLGPGEPPDEPEAA